jgi:hypothetical protein
VLNDNDGGTNLLRNDAGGSIRGCVTVYLISDGLKTQWRHLLYITDGSNLSGGEEDLRRKLFSIYKIYASWHGHLLSDVGTTDNWTSWSLVEFGGIVIELTERP